MSHFVWSQTFQHDVSSYNTSIEALVDLFKQGKIDEQEYIQWATEFYKIPLIKADFFAQSQTAELIKKYDFVSWNDTLYPIYEWNDTLYIACIEPLPLNAPTSVCLVLAPYSQLKEHFTQATQINNAQEVQTSHLPQTEDHSPDKELKNETAQEDPQKVAPVIETPSIPEASSFQPEEVPAESMQEVISPQEHTSTAKNDADVIVLVAPTETEDDNGTAQETDSHEELPPQVHTEDEPLATNEAPTDVASSEPAPAPQESTRKHPKKRHSSIDLKFNNLEVSQVVTVRPDLSINDDLSKVINKEKTHVPSLEMNVETHNTEVTSTPSLSTEPQNTSDNEPEPQSATTSNETETTNTNDDPVVAPTPPQPPAEPEIQKTVVGAMNPLINTDTAEIMSKDIAPFPSRNTEFTFVRTVFTDMLIDDAPQTISETTNTNNALLSAFRKLKDSYKHLMWCVRDANGKVFTIACDDTWNFVDEAWAYPLSFHLKSPFRLAKQTQKSYHGRVVKNTISEEFFSLWHAGHLPNQITIVPVKMENVIFAYLIACGQGTHYQERESLETAETTCIELTEKFTEIYKSLRKQAS